MKRLTTLLVAAAMIAGCVAKGAEGTGTAVADTTHPWRQPGDKIDSLLPMEEYLRRFRLGEPEVSALRGGEANRDALARSYLAAVSSRDTATLGRLLVTKAEFGWLIYPDQVYSRPPYELDPAIAWIQMGGESQKGMTRVVERYGGKSLRLERLACTRDTLQLVGNRMTIWSNCNVRYQAEDSVLTRRLFGSIVERGGTVKFLSYHSEF